MFLFVFAFACSLCLRLLDGLFVFVFAQFVCVFFGQVLCVSSLFVLEV